MKRKLVVVDYRDNGVYKHHILEVEQIGNMTDKEVVDMCHIFVGQHTILDAVIEIFTSKSADELERITSNSELEKLNMRPLYMNMDEVKKMRAMMGLTV
mgnify:CR=1 FL=1